MELNYIAFEFIQDCNLHCKYCYNVWKNPHLNYPLQKTTYKRAKKVLKKLYQSANVNHITFTGGEPLLLERLEELILFTRLKNTRVNLITNGILYNENRFENIHKLGVEAIEFTINHFTAKIHEALNQEEGSFNKTIKSIEYFKKIGSKPFVTIIITKQNYSDIDRTIQFVHDLGVNDIMINRINIGGMGMLYKDELIVNKEELNIAYRLADEKLAKLGLNAYSGITSPLCVVDPKNYTNIRFASCSDKIENKILTLDIGGNLRICNHSPLILGNVFETPVEEILKSEKSVCWNSSVPEFCTECNLIQKCKAGCRAASEQFYQDIDMPDPVVYTL